MRIVTSECLLYWTLDPGCACVDHFSSISNMRVKQKRAWFKQKMGKTLCKLLKRIFLWDKKGCTVHTYCIYKHTEIITQLKVNCNLSNASKCILGENFGAKVWILV